MTHLLFDSSYILNCHCPSGAHISQAYKITVQQLDTVTKWQGLDPESWAKPEDILMLRTGGLQRYYTLNATEKGDLPYSSGETIGMADNDESVKWLWDKKLAMVGADNPAFESTPFNGTIDGVARSLHQIFISGESFEQDQACL